MLRKNRGAIIGLVYVIGLIFIAALAPFVAPHDPFKFIDSKLIPPNSTYLLGLDDFGRDLFSRIIHGSRISLMVGVGVVSIALSVGTILGASAGYLGGKFDSIVMRIADLVLAFPGLVLAIALMAVLGQVMTVACIGGIMIVMV